MSLRREGITGNWVKLHNEVHVFYSPPNIVWVIRSRRISWVGHVAGMGEKSIQKFGWKT
jgi:hypothetical protein